jgi:hypothetical protein
VTIVTSKSNLVQAGDFAAVRVHGDVGRLIHLGEELNGDGFGDWEHAIFYAGGDQDLILEAEPGGAQLRPFHYSVTDVLWSSDNPELALEPAQRAQAMEIAEKHKGVPYSGLDYLALAAHRVHVPGWTPFWFGDKGHLVSLKTYVAETGHMICSQLADQCRLDMGSHLYDDKRWPGFVTPLNLANLILGT